MSEPAIDRQPFANLKARQSFARRQQITAAVFALRTEVNEMSPLSTLPHPQCTVSRIMEAVAEYFGLATIDLISVRKTRDVVNPRQIAMYLCLTETRHASPYVSRRFGRRDRKAADDAAHNVAWMLSQGNERLKADIAAIKDRLGLNLG